MSVDLIKCGKLRALVVDTEGITKADANNIEFTLQYWSHFLSDLI
ncbi:Uncharacterised protein [Enterobacter cancerogenus]|uniref:Uncharacterized protein n=1 Tax=Enterobacter cancerogenus TaxID=69218 RepID=A0A484XPS5_9ENTR|nr:Uncharacterised protein [Enterobacter cancerogenus]